MTEGRNASAGQGQKGEGTGGCKGRIVVRVPGYAKERDPQGENFIDSRGPGISRPPTSVLIAPVPCEPPPAARAAEDPLFVIPLLVPLDQEATAKRWARQPVGHPLPAMGSPRRGGRGIARGLGRLDDEIDEEGEQSRRRPGVVQNRLGDLLLFHAQDTEGARGPPHAHVANAPDQQ